MRAREPHRRSRGLTQSGLGFRTTERTPSGVRFRGMGRLASGLDAGFLIEDYEPAYLRTWREGGFDVKTEKALEELADCKACPRDCGVNRLLDERGVCHVSSIAPFSLPPVQALISTTSDTERIAVRLVFTTNPTTSGPPTFPIASVALSGKRHRSDNRQRWWFAETLAVS